MAETVTYAPRPRAAAPDAVITKVQLTSAGTSQPVYTPPECVVSVVPSSGTGKAQATFSHPADVAAGTATWHDWDAGDVSSPRNQLLLHAVAVRFVFSAAGVGEVAQ